MKQEGPEFEVGLSYMARPYSEQRTPTQLCTRRLRLLTTGAWKALEGNGLDVLRYLKLYVTPEAPSLPPENLSVALNGQNESWDHIAARDPEWNISLDYIVQ